MNGRFDIVKKLGQGTYGKVQLAINKETGQDVAIKTIKKAKIETEKDLIRIRREIQIMSSVTHPHIIHIYEVFENRDKMVLVMEYAAGGELYDYLSEKKVLAEGEARRIFRQVASACYYCHKHKICHRDLKLENILLDEYGNAKIADFGLSNVFDETRLLSTYCGSPLYASPEIVRGTPYVGPEVDCWSLGVLLYTLVYGAMPFDGSNFKKLVKQITSGDFYEPQKKSPASELIHALLTPAPEKRASMMDVCGHPWVNQGEEVPCLEAAEELAHQTPVRLDLLLSLAPQGPDMEHVLVPPPEEGAVPSAPEPSKAQFTASDSLSLGSAMEVRAASSPAVPQAQEPAPEPAEPGADKAAKRALDEAEEQAAPGGKTEKTKKKAGEKAAKKKKKPEAAAVVEPSDVVMSDDAAAAEAAPAEAEAPAAGAQEITPGEEQDRGAQARARETIAVSGRHASGGGDASSNTSAAARGR
ncbi:LOW QUALITY PROTEIN: NUAK family SNF1-like kinase 1 [Pollicipes pollicipes]|uniref:LOW QUALITY PROTEIN: NUAK family SNF1-like kinase 1 n=1 Tax=Pollicipes pollicipes TaxID=41117 RepID=UPI001884CFAB|nr:LOW QUALITY PROTEIN: NUAK family SNF1-like kinase 1 [Pollicipes pollicipes]